MPENTHRRERASRTRTDAVVAVFALAAELTERKGRTYDEWVREVTMRFERAWPALDGAL